MNAHTAENDAPAWRSCYTCRDYLSDNPHPVTLSERLADKARRSGRGVTVVVDEFMAAAHRRHLGGEPLRPGGPTRVLDPALGRLAALLHSVIPPVSGVSGVTE